MHDQKESSLHTKARGIHSTFHQLSGRPSIYPSILLQEPCTQRAPCAKNRLSPHDDCHHCHIRHCPATPRLSEREISPGEWAASLGRNARLFPGCRVRRRRIQEPLPAFLLRRRWTQLCPRKLVLVLGLCNERELGGKSPDLAPSYWPKVCGQQYLFCIERLPFLTSPYRLVKSIPSRQLVEYSRTEVVRASAAADEAHGLPSIVRFSSFYGMGIVFIWQEGMELTLILILRASSSLAIHGHRYWKAEERNVARRPGSILKCKAKQRLDRIQACLAPTSLKDQHVLTW